MSVVRGKIYNWLNRNVGNLGTICGTVIGTSLGWVLAVVYFCVD